MAKWIRSAEADGERTQITLFRKCFDWDGEGSVKIHISADTRYKLWVNGSLVSFGPAKGDDKVWFVDLVDLTGQLVVGRNVLAVAVLHYAPDVSEGNRSAFRSYISGLYVHSSLAVLNSNATWKACLDTDCVLYDENRFFAPLQIHEKTEGRRETSGFMQTVFDDTSWPFAREYALDAFYGGTPFPAILYPNKLRQRQIPLMKIEGEVSLRCPEHADGMICVPAFSNMVLTFDAGEEVNAFLVLSLAGGKGAKLEVLEAESYVYDVPVNPVSYSQIPRKGDREDATHGTLWGYTDYYTVGGFGTRDRPERYEPFWFRTFRYLKFTIHTAEEPLQLWAPSCRKTGYPLEVKTRLVSKDPVVNRIWDISLRTLRLCMLDTYIDCPFYEQLQYAMDARNEMRFTYAVSADDRLARQCIDDFARGQRPDGMINCSYPDVGMNVIPGFAIYVIGMLYDHMWYFGDRKLVKRYLPTVRKILGWFTRHLDKRGLVGQVRGAGIWNFIDWTSEWTKVRGVPGSRAEGPVTMESLLFSYGLKMTEDLAIFVGSRDLAQQCREQRSKLNAAIRFYCLDARGMVQDVPGENLFSQHCQVFSVLADVLPAEALKCNMREVMIHAGKYAQCSVAMLPYLFEALRLTGQYELTKPLWNVWKKMLDQHLTTCAEKEVNCRSDCHGWGALILYELPAVMLGVRPVAPGFAAPKQTEAGDVSIDSGFMTTVGFDVPEDDRSGRISSKMTTAGRLSAAGTAGSPVARQTEEGRIVYTAAPFSWMQGKVTGEVITPRGLVRLAHLYPVQMCQKCQEGDV